MKKKYDNTSDKFSDWTLTKLKEQARDYNDRIYGECACYGKSDLFILDGIMRELDKRGVVISSKLTFN